MPRLSAADAITLGGLLLALVQLGRGAYVRPRTRAPNVLDVVCLVAMPLLYVAANATLYQTPPFRDTVGMATHPLFPVWPYLSWLPFGYVIHRRWRRVLPATPASQSVLTVLLFVPCLNGVYGVFWLMPLPWQLLLVLSMAVMHPQVTWAFLPLTLPPLLVAWPLTYAAMKRRRGLFQSRRPLVSIPAAR